MTTNPRVSYEAMSPAEREQKLLRGPKHPPERLAPHLAPHDELIALVREIDADGDGLTEWEIGFISQLIDRRVKRFTPAQAKQIRRIHQERVS